MLRMSDWLSGGGDAPPPLHSRDLLPQILLLQQLRDQRRGTPTPTAVRRLSARWAQSGSIWRQLLRQWLLLEPLLLQLPVPLADPGLLQTELHSMANRLQAGGAEPAGPSNREQAQPEPDWLQEARLLQASAPLLLAIGQQISQLQQLLQSRALVRRAVEQQHQSQS
jgi:hypothetical protein